MVYISKVLNCYPETGLRYSYHFTLAFRNLPRSRFEMHLKSWLVAHLFNSFQNWLMKIWNFKLFICITGVVRGITIFSYYLVFGLHGVLHEDIDFTSRLYIIVTIFIVCL